MSKNKFFTLFLITPEQRNKDRAKIGYKTKRQESKRHKTVTIHPPKWACDFDGWVLNCFWPAEAGEYWLSSKMDEFAKDVGYPNADYYEPFYDEKRSKYAL